MPPSPRGADDPPGDDTLSIEGVHARRGGAEVLRGVDLDFAPGSRTAIIGASGSGKSTLLRLLNRLAEPSSGRIRLGGSPIETISVTTLRRRVGLVFQAPRPLPGSVRDNLSYPDHLRNVTTTDDLTACLTEVGLDPGWLDRDASGLSGGERQRLALAVALRTGPAVLALDEPTSALDPASARRVADALRLRSARDGLTTIAVTHSRDHCRWLGDRTVVLDAGRVVDLGPTDEVIVRADRSALRAEEAE